MQYFSVELCKKLQEKGFVSESEHVWGFSSYWEVSQYDKKYHRRLETPAFIFQDLLTKDNAVKLWGKLWDSEECNQQAWQYYSSHLLDLYQQSGLEAVENYLLENL